MNFAKLRSELIQANPAESLLCGGDAVFPRKLFEKSFLDLQKLCYWGYVLVWRFALNLVRLKSELIQENPFIHQLSVAL